jgi:ribosome recycling factor
VAGLSIPDPTLIVAQPWDATLIPKIEKAIRAANLGLNPGNDGKVVRIPVPPLTEERRKQLVKKVHEIAEHGRTAIRSERREANEVLKKLLKDHKISEDDERRGLEQVQKLTDQHVRQIDEMSKHKEDELLKI